MDAAVLLEAVRTIVGGVVVVLGLAFMLGGAIGVLRFPDYYTRLHAHLTSDGIGAALVVFGLAIAADDGALTVRLLLLASLIAALAPTLSHLAANTAHSGGLAPVVGRLTAPRPGVRKEAGDV